MINVKSNIHKLTPKTTGKTTGRVLQSVFLLIHDYVTSVQKVRRQRRKRCIWTDMHV